MIDSKELFFNDQYSKWAPVVAAVPQGPILQSLLFLIYINDLPRNLESPAKLLADDTLLFSTVYDLSKFANLLNNDLKKNQNGFSNGKCYSNLTSPNKLKKSFFSRKITESAHPIVFLMKYLLLIPYVKSILEYI